MQTLFGYEMGVRNKYINRHYIRLKLLLSAMEYWKKAANLINDAVILVDSNERRSIKTKN